MAIKPGKITLPRKVASVARTQSVVSGKTRGEQLRSDRTRDVNGTIATSRAKDPSGLIRELFSTNGLVSTTILSMVQLANSGYKLAAFDTASNQFSRDGLAAASYMVSRFSTLWDYTQGYSDKLSIETLTERALLEVALTGGLGAELVLDKARQPDRLVLFPYDTVEFQGDGKGGRVPTQRRSNPKPGQDATVVLNYPNVWVAENVKQLNRIYSEPIFVSSLKKLIHYEEFVEDMRRVVRQTGQPRLLVKLNYESVRNSAPPEVQQDSNKLQGYLSEIKSEIEKEVKNLSPEDALVYYDIVEVDSVDTVGEKSDYKELLDAMSGLTASALKSNPSILGLRIGGSQNTSSTESMLFAHVAEVLQGPVEDVMSRALTLSVRLMGIDVYVRFHFNDIDLRPKAELAGHRAIAQASTLELLSLGRISDDEAQFRLGLGMLPEGAPQLSGTFFYKPSAVKGTDVSESTRDNPNGKEQAPEEPERTGGPDNEQRKI